MARVELEKLFEVWAEDWHYEIGPDRDGLGCLEIRYYEGQKKECSHRLSFGKQEASLIAKALIELSAEE